ncbi:alpha/beta hydrolase [Halieaceae bacterium IMCC14734]|uniref:Alpha/beta hydrolase n=1 Tax=Candidatus Litorirhabdus singularis TaxID=2518993 RepID=A0ABT3TEQ8_9GAMM|nr:alpha/beta hydrolase [Candidatus Litorirhabdus singularis]MCX2980266.1 alpha/beta hydrolase [Candidatus Litorirhabdus singularis]
MLDSVEHLQISTNGIELHVASLGSGPLVIMCHGFPGLWYSWRKQMPAIAAAGFRALAVDTRGYGRSDRPQEFSAYDSQTQVADILGILDVLGEQQAIFIGQDFGAPLVWNICARAPQRVRAAVVFGVPYDFESAVGDSQDSEVELLGGSALSPSEQYALVAQDHFFHMHYFQTIGPADAELNAQPREFLTRLYWALSAKGNLLDWRNYPSDGTGYLDVLEPAGQPLPWSWMSEADMDYIVGEYTSAGAELTFRGGLSAYRVQDINWQIAKGYQGVKVDAPVLFMMGADDPVRDMMPAAAFEHMRSGVPNLTDIHYIDNAGHFVMQEQSEAVNALLIPYLTQYR